MWQWEFQKSTEKKLESSLHFHPNRILRINDETQDNQTKYWYLYKDQIQIIKTMKPFCMEESIPSRNWKMVIVWTRTSKCSWSLQLFVLICSAAPRNSQSHPFVGYPTRIDLYHMIGFPQPWQNFARNVIFALLDLYFVTPLIVFYEYVRIDL